MADLSAKLGIFEQHINAAAEADARNMIADAEKRAEAMIKEELERLENDRGSVLGTKLSKYRADERKRVSERRYAADRKVLMHRNSLVADLFGEIGKELEALAASDKYEAHLNGCAEAADRREKIDGTVCIYCRKDLSSNTPKRAYTSTLHSTPHSRTSAAHFPQDRKCSSERNPRNNEQYHICDKRTRNQAARYKGLRNARDGLCR